VRNCRTKSGGNLYRVTLRRGADSINWIAGEIDGRIQLARPIQVGDFVADVARRDEPVRGDLSLYSKIPLLHARDACVGVEIVEDSVGGVIDIFVQSEREWSTTREIAIRIVKTACRSGYHDLSAPRRALPGGQVQFHGADV